MKIIIIANFVNFEWENGNCRFAYLLKKFDYKNNEVEIITSDFFHSKKEKRKKIEKKLPYKITLISEPGYKKNVCLKRFFSHFVWGKRVKKYLLGLEKKPDIIYCSVPSLTAPLNVAKYCDKNGIRFIIDIQDLWPEAFQMIFNPPILNKIIYKPFKIMADGIYKRADEICAVSETYADRALTVNKKCKKAHVVFLGTDLKLFDENSKKDIVTDNINNEKCIIPNKELIIINNKDFKLYKPKNEKWIAYCGTLGSSYDLENAIMAISKIKNENIRFIIMGDGPLYEKFIKKTCDMHVKAIFTGRIPYDMMCSILCKCDITINPIMHGAAQSIINKHADYTASGLPIISTQECEEFRKLVNEYDMGFNCKNSDIKEITMCIKKLIDDKNLRLSMGKNARLCAEERFNRNKTYDKLINIIYKNKQDG